MASASGGGHHIAGEEQFKGFRRAHQPGEVISAAVSRDNPHRMYDSAIFARSEQMRRSHIKAISNPAPWPLR